MWKNIDTHRMCTHTSFASYCVQKSNKGNLLESRPEIAYDESIDVVAWTYFDYEIYLTKGFRVICSYVCCCLKVAIMFILPFAGPTDLSMKKQSSKSQLSAGEIATIKQLIGGYRESAAFLYRSADELEQLLLQQN